MNKNVRLESLSNIYNWIGKTIVFSQRKTNAVLKQHLNNRLDKKCIKEAQKLG